MTSDQKLEIVYLQCKILIRQLTEIKPDDELLVFSRDEGDSREESVRKSKEFTVRFSPEEFCKESPHCDPLLLMWESYASALETAIYIENARRGLYNSNP